jgi:predicted branched-subunit amino acid permease
MVPSLLGVLLASRIPAQWGLGFAGILALLGILCALATQWMRLLACAVAGAAAVAAYALPFRLNIVFAIAIAVLACLLLERRLSPRRAAP